MKNLKIMLFSLAFLTVGITLSSCGDSATEGEKTGKEYTSEYVCPMHCEDSGSDKPGTCPVCGMDYKANSEHKADGHNH